MGSTRGCFISFRLSALSLMLAISACSGGGGTHTNGAAAVVPQTLQAAQGLAENWGAYATVVRADHPVSYFRLDDTSPTVAVDSGFQGLNGTYFGVLTLAAPSLLTSDADPAVNFLGGSMKVGNTQAVQPSAALSVEAWIEPSAAATNAQLVKIVSNSQSWSAPYDAYLLGLQNGQPMFRVVIAGTPITATAPAALLAQSRHHLVGTYDGTAVRLWVDGHLGGAVAASGPISNYTADGWAIGADVAGQWVFRGLIDEVAIYQSALTLNRILTHEAAAGSGTAYASSILAANPVGYYRLDEALGAVAYDASPTNNQGSYGQGVGLNGPGGFGAGEGAANFSNGVVSIPRTPAQFPGIAVTVEAIAQPTAQSLSALEVKLVSAGTPWTAPYESYKLSLDYGHPGMAVATDQGNFQVIADSSVTAGQFVHLTGSYDGTTLAIYGNGQLLKSAKASGTLLPSTGSGIGLGGDVTANWLYRGGLSNVAIYPTALLPQVIQAHAALVPGLSPMPSLLAPTPTGVTLSQARVDLLSMGDSAQVTASEPNYSGSFSVGSTTCATIATLQVQGATFTVLPRAAGLCQATIVDEQGHGTNLPISVTLTSIVGQ